MGRVIAIANQKGGVGKSTTTINLASCLSEKGKKVLVVDFDPQGNTTSGFGIDKVSVEHTVYHLLIGMSQLDECIQKNILPNLSLISSNFDLAGAEIELMRSMEIEQAFLILKKNIDQIKEDYDFIVIDCPPSLGILTGNAMASADTVIVPIQCEYYALEGLSQVLDTTKRIRDWLNPKLEIEGVVFTMFDARTNLSLQVVENVKDNLNYNIYKTIIPKNVRLAEAPSHGLPINLYDSKSAGAEGYRSLAEEVIERGEEKEWL